MSNLDARLLAAHDRGDQVALIALYTEAADCAPTGDAAGFFLTHAYVFALELNHPATAALKARLVAEGRDLPDG